jgi:hypothetical protein
MKVGKPADASADTKSNEKIINLQQILRGC